MPSPPSGGSSAPSGGSSSPGGSSGPSGSPPSGGEQSSGDQGGSDSDQNGSQEGSASGQQGESIEGLDAELDASLEGFDENVGGSSSQDSDEIDILSPSGSSGVAADEPLFEEADTGIPGESNAEIEQAAQDGPEGQSSAPGAEGEPASQGSATDGGEQQTDTEIIPIPDDIDDGQGDDIVLRQIRDAAMKEKDPVLRERLWDEYRRIKNQ